MKKVSKKNKAVIKKYTQKDARKMMIKSAIPSFDLNMDLNSLADEILPKMLHGNKKEREKGLEQFNEISLRVMFAMEIDTHVAMMEAFDMRYRGLIKELSCQIIADYDATTSAEKALAEVVASSFIRIIDSSRRLNNGLGGPGMDITENITKYQNMLSLQLDRANRQFLNALTTLKQIKAPLLDVKIKANTAFIGEKQQFNVNKESDASK